MNDWWNYRDRKKIKTEYAETINRMIAATPNSNLIVAVPTSSLVAQREIRRATGGQRLHPRDDVRLHRDLDPRLQGRPLLQRTGIARRRGSVRDRLRRGRRAFPGRQRDRQIGLDQWPAFQSHRRKLRARERFSGFSVSDSIVVMPLPAFQKIFQREERSRRPRESARQDANWRMRRTS